MQWKITKNTVQRKSIHKMDGGILIAEIYKNFFNLNFFLLCSPFRVAEISDKPGQPVKFVRKTWFPQKLLCTLLFLLTAYWIYYGTTKSWIQISPTVPENKNPKILFEAAWRYLNTLAILASFRIIWFKQEKFVEVMNFIVKHFPYRNPRFLEFRFWKDCHVYGHLSLLLCCVHVIVAVISALFGRGVFSQISASEGQQNDNLSEALHDLSCSNTGYSSIERIACVALNITWFHRLEIYKIFRDKTEKLLFTSVDNEIFIGVDAYLELRPRLLLL